MVNCTKITTSIIRIYSCQPDGMAPGATRVGGLRGGRTVELFVETEGIEYLFLCNMNLKYHQKERNPNIEIVEYFM